MKHIKILSLLAALLIMAAFATVQVFSIANEAETEDSSMHLCNLEQARVNDEQLVSFFELGRYGEIVYPDFIGGIFYNEDGNMVLQIVRNAARSSEQYNLVSEFANATDDIIVEHVNFSQNEINAVMAILDAYWQAEERPEVFDNIDSYHMDTINNRVEVWLRVYNEAEINRFRDTVLDSPIIYLTESIGQIATLGSGDPLFESPNSSWPLLIVLSLGLVSMLTIFLWRQKRTNLALQTASGDIVIESAPVSKKQTIIAIKYAKRNRRAPKDDLFADIIKKIDKNDIE